MTGLCYEAETISQLPDDIVTLVISRLPWRDATATSILSTHWLHFHLYTSRLVFAPFKPLIGVFGKIDETEFDNYVNTINHTLDSYKGGHLLEEFKVNLPSLCGANIEMWLEFALMREAKNVNISIDAPCLCAAPAFPLADLVRNYRVHPQLKLGLKSLKELSLCGVNMGDVDIASLVSNCRALERLSIKSCDSFENISIFDHLNLRHIDISSCGGIERVEFCALTNLESVTFHELQSSFVLVLKNVPKFVTFDTCDFGGNVFDQIATSNVVKEQLMCLKVSTDPTHVRTIELDYMLPKLMNLRQLEIEAHMYSGCSSHQFIHLTEACPRLEKLQIKFVWWACKLKERARCGHILGGNAPNRHLREVKLLEFSGCPSEQKLAAYVINKAAVALKQLIIEPYYGEGRKIRRRARARAWHLFRPMISNSVNLVVI